MSAKIFSNRTPRGPGAYPEVEAHPMAKSHSAGPWNHRGHPDRTDDEQSEVFFDLPEIYDLWPLALPCYSKDYGKYEKQKRV